jgi:hypothetical protein
MLAVDQSNILHCRTYIQAGLANALRRADMRKWATQLPRLAVAIRAALVAKKVPDGDKVERLS